jgi:carbon monoxide dehydrogenase subunit G
MKFEGRVEIHAPRAKVWAFVTDPDQIASCAPGVQSIEKLDGGRFKAHAKVGSGFFSAKVVVDVEFTKIHEPDDATVHARGHVPGSAVDATAKMVLTDGADGSTAVDWTADVTISGMLASVGAGRIDGTANKGIGQTFDCIKAKLEA